MLYITNTMPGVASRCHVLQNMLAHATVVQVIKYTPRVGGLCIYIYELQRLYCPYFTLTMHGTANNCIISIMRKTSMVATVALRAGLTVTPTGCP